MPVACPEVLQDEPQQNCRSTLNLIQASLHTSSR